MTTTEPTTTTKPTRPWTLSISREELERRIKRKPARQIAKSLRVSHTTVRDHLIAFGIESPWGPGRPKKNKRKRNKMGPASPRSKQAKLNITDAELVARINAGETEKDVGDAFGVSRQRVHQRLQRSGLEYVRHSVKREISDEALVAMVAEKTQEEVAKELGVNKVTVGYWLRNSGRDYVRHDRGRSVTVTDEEIVRRLAEGETQSEIAHSLGITQTTLSRWLSKCELDYVRHAKGGPGRNPVRGSKAWRLRRASEAAVRVAEYARSVRAEHDRERSNALLRESALITARTAILAGRPFDALSAIDDALRSGQPMKADPVEVPEAVREPITEARVTNEFHVDTSAFAGHSMLDALMAALGYDTTGSTLDRITTPGALNAITTPTA